MIEFDTKTGKIALMLTAYPFNPLGSSGGVHTDGYLGKIPKIEGQQLPLFLCR